MSEIETRCPSCGNTTLFLSDSKSLVCAWIQCKEPVPELYVKRIQGELAEAEKRIEEADAARKHAQAEGTRLVEANRALQKQAIEFGRRLGEMETVDTVTTWANETFGPATVRVQIERAKKEWDELLDAIEAGNMEKVAIEAADVCICLYRVIGTLKPSAIDDKMEINRARKWLVSANGTAQHIKEPAQSSHERSAG